MKKKNWLSVVSIAVLTLFCGACSSSMFVAMGLKTPEPDYFVSDCVMPDGSVTDMYFFKDSLVEASYVRDCIKGYTKDASAEWVKQYTPSEVGSLGTIMKENGLRNGSFVVKTDNGLKAYRIFAAPDFSLYEYANQHFVYSSNSSSSSNSYTTSSSSRSSATSSSQNYANRTNLSMSEVQKIENGHYVATIRTGSVLSEYHFFTTSSAANNYKTEWERRYPRENKSGSRPYYSSGSISFKDMNRMIANTMKEYDTPYAVRVEAEYYYSPGSLLIRVYEHGSSSEYTRNDKIRVTISSISAINNYSSFFSQTETYLSPYN